MDNFSNERESDLAFLLSLSDSELKTFTENLDQEEFDYFRSLLQECQTNIILRVLELEDQKEHDLTQANDIINHIKEKK